jgi:NCS1 family nucleobase:cation symporter-1
MEDSSLEPVKPEKRIFSAWIVFALWFCVGISIAEFWAGALLTPSLSLWTTLLVIFLGHILGNFLIGLIAVQGQKTGVPTMVLVRKTFGIKGSILPSLLNYFQLIGWTAIMLIISANAMNEVARHFGFGNYILWILLLGFLVTLWSYIGPSKWHGLENVSAILLLLLSFWLTYVVFKNVPIKIPFSKPGTGAIGFMLGLDLVVAMPISWAPVVADYSRYAKTKKGAFWGTTIGYFFSSGLFFFLGALTNVTVGKSDPIGIIAAFGLGIPAMVIIVFATTTTTFLDVYSASISLKNIWPKIDVKKQILFVGFLGTLLALLFPIDRYQSFLLLIGGAFTSLAAIMIVDYFLIQKEYARADLFEKAPPLVMKTVYIWMAGFLLYISLSMDSLFGIHIPIMSALGFKVGSTIPTLLFVGLLYYFVFRRKK